MAGVAIMAGAWFIIYGPRDSTYHDVAQCQSSPTFVMLYTFVGHLFVTS